MTIRSRTHTFPPGSLESMTVRTTVLRRDQVTRAALYSVTVSGYYAVYCGMGNAHLVRVNERDTVWSTNTRDKRTVTVGAAHFGSSGAAEEVARMFIEYALENWYDPCEDVIEEEYVDA